MRIPRRWYWFLTAGLGLLLAAGLWYALRPPPPLFPKGAFESVTLVTIVRPEEERSPSLTRSSTDAERIEALSAVLRRAEATHDHKCADVGSITFRSKDGSETRLGILPGHERKYYEYRAYTDRSYDNFRVPRDAFLRAMVGLGVAELPSLDR